MSQRKQRKKTSVLLVVMISAASVYSLYLAAPPLTWELTKMTVTPMMKMMRKKSQRKNPSITRLSRSTQRKRLQKTPTKKPLRQAQVLSKALSLHPRREKNHSRKWSRKLQMLRKLRW